MRKFPRWFSFMTAHRLLATKPEVHQVPASPENYGSRRAAGVDTIVLHTMEGGAAGTARWLADPDAGVSYHYGIGRDGRIYQYVDESYAAWHAGNGAWNRHSVGISMEGRSGDPEMFTDPMYEGLFSLCRYLTSKYAIKPTRSTIIGHFEVPHPTRRGRFGGLNGHTDPGPHFPWWERLLADLSNPPFEAIGGSNV